MKTIIIGGEFKNRPLVSPKTNEVRPLSSRVRKSLMDVLGSMVIDCTLLDLFAGIGSVSIEFLSRGAKSVVSVEKNPKIANFLKKNLENFNLLNRCTILNYSAEKFLLNCHDIKFDIIYMDPPFSYDLETLLQIFSNFKGYHKKSVFILHHFFKNKPKEKLGYWKMLDSRTYSSNTITFYVPEDYLDD
ncbi:16S rRNA (guanine-N(2))-methyltransferase RsmD [Thermodesulfobium acidiphilum]|uniref:16S rRNA (Guanine-N(2))-methyltransferase RsmD n=1 Tax=Thermodesulfobium acidiphilum TaxID=1794699 RepID=A0A2R4W214_THEAF|nr:16S rRNA (guanine(966)-N(2))-methyltransferase RsmD [Thermodesulfobium acidiphilum]AWB10851.1 16S rRNA (guanine-N(2))-methyltransferase RsmD [Thermodesulfobium acidiphilum]